MCFPGGVENHFTSANLHLKSHCISSNFPLQKYFLQKEERMCPFHTPLGCTPLPKQQTKGKRENKAAVHLSHLSDGPVAFISVCAPSLSFYLVEGTSSCPPFQLWSLQDGDLPCKPLYAFLPLITNRETQEPPVSWGQQIVSLTCQVLTIKTRAEAETGSSASSGGTAAPHRTPTSSCSQGRLRNLPPQIFTGFHPEAWGKWVNKTLVCWTYEFHQVSVLRLV